MRQLHRSSPLIVAAILLSGCAGGTGNSGVSPTDMPALEAEVQAHPTDGNRLTKLGVGYYGQKNWERARDAFKAAIAVDANNYRAIVYLGLTYEEMGALDSARATYGVARTKAKGDRQKTELDNRLQLLTHKELQAAARVALAQESTLSQQAPTANTIAVFPFRYLGTNEAMRPLEPYPEYLEASFKVIAERHGSPAAFVKHHADIDDAMLARFAEAIVE